MIVNPEGRVDTCSILLSSGYADLDLVTCNIATKKARFAPARDDTGKVIYSTYRQVVSWRIALNGTSRGVLPTPEMPPDFDLTLNQAPEGVMLPVQVQVSYFIKANGMTSHCQVSDAAKPPPQVLVDLACKAVMQQPIQVIRNRNNEPVDGSNCTTVVRFSLDSRKR